MNESIIEKLISGRVTFSSSNKSLPKLNCDSDIINIQETQSAQI